MNHPKVDIESFAFAAQQAAIKAGQILREGFYTEIKTTSKSSRHDVVTIFDTKSEECIFSILQEAFPSHVCMGEESGLKTDPTGKVVWIIDPLDETLNFSRQLPIFTISIAAVYDHEVLCGVIYQPMTDELFVAKKELGAFLNGKRIHVSQTKEVLHGIYAIGFPYIDLGESPKNVDYCFDLLNQGTPIRNIGSGALNMAYLAAGRFDGFWIPSLYSWDMAAGLLMIEEAGGKVTRQDGRCFEQLVMTDPLDILATNGHLHEELLNSLKNIQSKYSN